MHYMNDDWFEEISHRTRLSCLVEKIDTPEGPIDRQVFEAMRNARTADLIHPVEGIERATFLEGHEWNEFCEDPDSTFSAGMHDGTSILGRKVQAMIYETARECREENRSWAWIDQDGFLQRTPDLSRRIAVFLEDPILDLEADKLHRIHDFMDPAHRFEPDTDRFCVEIENWTPRALVLDTDFTWRPIAQNTQVSTPSL